MTALNKNNEVINGNQILESAIIEFHEDPSKEGLILVLSSIELRMCQHGNFLIPVETSEDLISKLDWRQRQEDGKFILNEDMRFQIRQVQDSDGKIWSVAFTSEAEKERGEDTSIIIQPIEYFLKQVMVMEDTEGIIINPWKDEFFLSKKLIMILFKADEESQCSKK